MKQTRLKIRKGDQVFVRTGPNKGKKGKVLRTFPGVGRVVIEGVNMKKKHVRPKKAGEKGNTVFIPAPLHSSNVMVICPSCSKPTKVAHKAEGKSKARVCKKCKNTIN